MTTTRSDLSERYLAYCDAHGRTPEEQIEADKALWPGGKMCGFILWMNAQWQAFAAPRNIERYSIESYQRRGEFDLFIAAQLGSPKHPPCSTTTIHTPEPP